MLTEAEITAIDYTTNTCSVRVPYFEHAGFSAKAIVTANFAITPGTYNGYKVGDVVFIGFERNLADKPIILGKIYKGSTFESAAGGGTVLATDFIATNSASLPITTKIVGSNNSYDTFVKIINRLKDFDQFEETSEIETYGLQIKFTDNNTTYTLLGRTKIKYSTGQDGFTELTTNMSKNNMLYSSGNIFPIAGNVPNVYGIAYELIDSVPTLIVVTGQSKDSEMKINMNNLVSISSYPISGI